MEEEKTEENKNLKTEEIKLEEVDMEGAEKKLQECQVQKQEYLAGWQRARADFLNYKKEEIERISEILKYGAEELILKILPILDNFNLVEKNLPENLKDNEYLKGVFQIKKQLEDFLKNQGIEEIEIKAGDSFDPNFQEIVEEVDMVDIKEKKGKIVEVVEKGYKLQGKIIKPAKVKIGK
ncbi:nucleotide exchange factor GrpE [Patescibacteria group bacterium]|nr:nucleotide exchange factor GrpE [Patescibacteria group bacterium]